MKISQKWKDRGAMAIVFASVIILAYCTYPRNANAWEPMVQLGMHHTSYDEELRSGYGPIVRVGIHNDGQGVYIWGSREEPKPAFHGQVLGTADVNAYGLGAFSQITPSTRLFLEGGIYKIDTTVDPGVTREVVHREMTREFRVEGEYHPGQRWWLDPIYSDKWGDVTEFHTEYRYDLDDTWIGRVGITMNVTDFLVFSGSYRYARADEQIQMWDVGQGIPERSYLCGCWWMNQQTRNFNGFEIGVLLEW